eukprot:8707433-Alexandrium_andersonii.AAC.1
MISSSTAKGADTARLRLGSARRVRSFRGRRGDHRRGRRADCSHARRSRSLLAGPCALLGAL